MSTFEGLLTAYEKQVGLTWQSDAPQAARTWLLWFDKSMQRRFTGRIQEFEHATIKSGHGWKAFDLANWFGRWIGEHEFFDALIHQPNELRGLLPDAERALLKALKNELADCTDNDVFAIDGCASLFGVVRVSAVISKIAESVPGRMLVSFPGKHAAGIYRLLDARDGWNYHAIPIPSDSVI